MGDGIRGCRVSNFSEQIRIRVFAVIHIHTGEGIGVGPFFGLFFHARVDTFVCAHRHTKNTHLPMWNHSERTQRLIFGNRIFRQGLERNVKKHCLHHLFIISVCTIAASSVRLAHKLKIFFFSSPTHDLKTLYCCFCMCLGNIVLTGCSNLMFDV